MSFSTIYIRTVLPQVKTAIRLRAILRLRLTTSHFAALCELDMRIDTRRYINMLVAMVRLFRIFLHNSKA